MNAVSIGRAMAVLIIVASFAYSVKAATDAFANTYWIFLTSFVTPLALGFGIIMVTEVLRELRNRQG